MKTKTMSFDKLKSGTIRAPRAAKRGTPSAVPSVTTPAPVTSDAEEADSFYRSLGNGDAAWAKNVAEAIRQKSRDSIQTLMDTGKMLCEAKKRLGHNFFLPWVRLEFPKQERWCQMRMAAYRVFQTEKISDLAKFDQTALYKLSTKDTKKARMEALAMAKAGKWVSCITAIALVQKHKGPREGQGGAERIRSLRITQAVWSALDGLRVKPDEPLSEVLMRAVAALEKKDHGRTGQDLSAKDATDKHKKAA